jgi:hypothetical protein
LRKTNSPFDENFHENNEGNCNSPTLTSHFGWILYAFRLPGKKRKKERKKSATLLSYKPLSKCLSRLGALHVDIICRWVVGVTKVAISSYPRMFRGLKIWRTYL